MDENNVQISRIKEVLQELVGDELLILFGAGANIRQITEKIDIDFYQYIFDNDMEKSGKAIGRYTIAPADEIIGRDKSAFILITCRNYQDIVEQLVNYGFKNILWYPIILKWIETERAIDRREVETCLIESTSACNAKCSFCANPHMKREKAAMSMETFEVFIEQLNKENIIPHSFRLHCSGEPLLDKNIFLKIKRLRETFPICNIGFTTNFSVANETMISKLLDAQLNYITISVNAISANEYREIMGLDYEKTIDNIHQLLQMKKEKKSNLQVILSIVVDQNDENLVETFKAQWDTFDVTVRIMRKGEWVETKSQCIDEDIPSWNMTMCSFLYNQIVVLSNGSYGLCCFDAEGNMPQMNIFNTSVREQFNSGVKRHLRRNFLLGKKPPAFCKACSFKIY